MRIYSNVYDYAIYALNYYEDKYFISLFASFKHKAKICDHCMYTQIIIKKFLLFSKISSHFGTFCKKVFLFMLVSENLLLIMFLETKVLKYIF